MHHPDPAYEEFLFSKFWKRIAAKKKIRHKRCQVCGSKQRLNVHHLVYRPNPYEVELCDLMVLCRLCHKRVHQLSSDGKVSFEKDDPSHRLAVVRHALGHKAKSIS